MDSSSLSSDLSEPPSSEPPSSPLSELSKSPSLSPSTATRSDGLTSRYLSPSSSAPSGRASPMNPMKHSSEPEPEGDTICAHPDGAPPPKRRRVEPKPRTTEYLNLRPGSADSEKDQALLNQLVSVLRKKKKIVIIAGAGISVSAGIPDFRSSHGLFKTVKSQHGLKASGQQLFDASVYKHDESTSNFHDMVRQLAQQTKKASPTPFHHLIASLAEEGRLLRLYSQNVDCIDTAMKPLATKVPLNAKGPWPKTVQMHGGLDTMQCTKCHETYPFDGSLFEGPEPPPCQSCVETDNVRTSHAGKRSHGIGRMRPRMVLYNEYNPDTEAICNVIKADMRSRPDAVLVVGTTLKIPGVRKLVKDMCGVTRSRRDGVAAWVNLDPEPSGADLRDCWDIVVRGKCDDVARLVGLPHWDESHELGDDVKVDDKAFEESKGTKGRHFFSQGALEVRIPSPTLSSSASASVKDESRGSSPVDAKPKPINKVQGIPTPTASPKIRTALPSRPSEKTKQSQIVFGGKTAKPEDAPAQAAPRKQLPTQRKPRLSKKKAEPKPPAATVKSAFKATKAAPAQKPAKPAKACVDVAPPKGNAPPIETRTEFSLRPTVTRQRRETYMAESESKKDQAEVSSQLQQETIVHHSPPTTPTELECPGSSQSQTISPPSKPRGLDAFID